MQKLVKNSFYGLVGILLVGQGIIANALDTGQRRIDDRLIGDTRSLDQAGQSIIIEAMSFLYILAVVYGLWGGFNILTAGGDEDKVKKGKTIIIHAVIGLIVIWLANSIIGWVVNSLLSSS